VRERALFVSPHLDDAVLSCAGQILDERARGAEVVVATLCSRGGDDAQYAGRRAEDRAALALLGVEGAHLDLLDAPARRGHAPAFRPLILDEHERDVDDARAFAAAIARAAAGAARVYLPLGAGRHVDHRLAFEASFSVGGEIRFYEDRPYALVPGAVAARLREIGARVSGGELERCDAATYRAALEAAPFMRAYLPEGAERAACLDELTARFERPPAPARLSLHAITRRFDAATAERARAAIAAYRSQLADLFGDAPILDEKNYFERSWIRR